MLQRPYSTSACPPRHTVSAAEEDVGAADVEDIGAKKMEDHSEDKDFLLDVDLPKELLPSPATPKQRNETETREEWDGLINEGSVCGSSVNEGSDWAYSISEGSVEEIDAIL